MFKGMDNAYSRLLKELQPWLRRNQTEIHWPPVEFASRPASPNVAGERDSAAAPLVLTTHA